MSSITKPINREEKTFYKINAKREALINDMSTEILFCGNNGTENEF